MVMCVALLSASLKNRMCFLITFNFPFPFCELHLHKRNQETTKLWGKSFLCTGALFTSRLSAMLITQLEATCIMCHTVWLVYLFSYWLFWSSNYFQRVHFLFPFSFVVVLTAHYEHSFCKTRVLIKLSFIECLYKSFFYSWDYAFLLSWLSCPHLHIACLVKFLLIFSTSDRVI